VSDDSPQRGGTCIDAKGYLVTTNPGPTGPYIPAQAKPQPGVYRLRPRHMRAPNESSTTTRHLSAGAYLDEDFCRESLTEVYNQKRRLVAPSYGFDLATVLWHCQQARRINLVRDAILAGVFLLGLCLNPVGVLVAGALLLAVHLGITAWRLSRDFLTQIKEGNTSGQLQIAMRVGYLGVGATVLLTLVGVAAGYTLAAALEEGFSSSANAQPQTEETIAALLTLGSTLLIIAVSFGAPIGAELWRQTKLARLIPSKAEDVNVTGGRLQEIRWQEQGNMTVYSGFRPFVGAGDELETTGFALRVVAKEQDPNMPLLEWQREFDQPPFTAVELVDHLRSRLIELSHDGRPERRIPGLVVTDRVFMAGTEVDMLSPYIQSSDVENVIIPQPVGPVRHYLSAQVQSWDGEVVTTVYLHVALQGRTLYLETSTWVLAPCDERFRSIDYVDNQGKAQFMWALLRGLVQAPRVALRCGINLARAGLESFAGSLSSKNSHGRDVETGFDYGARFSVRERGSSGLARNAFQVHDAVKYKRIIERRVVATVLDFLEGRGVDTSEFRQRATAILNQGTIIGSINNSQLRDINTGPVGAPESGK
jgi:hypothetical protein